MGDSVNFDRLVAKLFPGSQFLRDWALKGGISTEMIAFEIVDPHGNVQRCILRRPAKAAPRRNSLVLQDEFKLLQIIHPLGISTPVPYACDCSGEVLAEPYLVIGFIEGDPDFRPANTHNFAVQMAEELSRIHSMDGLRPDMSFLCPLEKRPAIQQQPLREELSLDWNPILKALVQTGWPFPRHNTQVLLHGDYWPGNLLWQDCRLVAVIDWEDAAIGDPLADLAISRLDLLWIYGKEVMDSFTRHYLANAAIDTRSLPCWDLYAAYRLARLVGTDLNGWAAFFRPYGRGDITGQSIRERHRYFVDQALEKL